MGVKEKKRGVKSDTKDLDLSNQKNGDSLMENEGEVMFEGTVEVRSYILDMINWRLSVQLEIQV